MDLDNNMLEALAEGVMRLENGDPGQVAIAQAVRRSMAEKGFALSRGEWIPAAEVSGGYVKKGVYASQGIGGRWWVDGYAEAQELAPAQTLYLDYDCTVPLRTVGVK